MPHGVHKDVAADNVRTAAGGGHSDLPTRRLESKLADLAEHVLRV